MSFRRMEHEKYLESILSCSLSSKNPSDETFKKALKDSPAYFNKLKLELLDQYETWDLTDIDGSEVIQTEYGETLKITQKERINFSLKNKKEDIESELLSNLKLLPGIGISTESKLNEKGYQTIYDLLNHDRFSKNAKILIEDIKKSCFIKEFNLLKEFNKQSNTKNNTLKALGSLDSSNLKFMDIETLGLSNVPIILIGVAELKGKYIISNQYLLRDKIEEPAVIQAYLSHLDEASVHVTYNGSSFDIPFIKNRARLFRLNPYILNQIHYDLIYPARILWKSKLPNCKLTTIEEYLFNIKRINDVPGRFIPDYYETFLSKQNIGPLVPIIEHNRKDIISLASFLMKIYDEI